MNTPSIHPDALLAHSDWIRRLVAGLVYDPGRADDVLQETWLVAMQRPPKEDRDLGAWLATVARHVASNSGRGESRRRQREKIAAKLEALPDTVDVIDRARLQARMAEAVLALEEPYRSCVLLRFFEELPPREIARRLGRPANTVRSQIQRGLGILRSELDAEYGDRQTWGIALLPFAGLGPRLSAGSLLPAKASVGSLWSKWILAAALVMTLGTGLWVLVPRGGRAPVSAGPELAVASARARDVDESDGGALPLPAEPRQRTSIQGERVAAGVEVELLDPVTGRPAPGVPWWVVRTGSFDIGAANEPEKIPRPLHSGKTDRWGIAAFPLPEDALVHFFTARTADYARGSWPLQPGNEAALVHADGSSGPLRLSLPLSIGGTIRGRAVDREGEARAGVSLTRRTFFHEEEVLGQTDEDGLFEIQRMADLPRQYLLDDRGQPKPALVDPERLRFDSIGDLDSNGSTRTVEIEAPFGPTVPPLLELGDVLVRRPWIQPGSVVDGEGNPVSGALVSCLAERLARVDGEAHHRALPFPWEPGGELLAGDALTDESGRFSLNLGITYEYSAPRRLCAFSPEAQGKVVSLELPGESTPPLVLVIEDRGGGPTDGFELHLVDAEQPDEPLWHFDPANPKLAILPLRTESDWGGRERRLSVPKNGRVWLTPSLIQCGGGPLLLQLDGYGPLTVDVDFAEAGATVALQREPTVEIAVDVHGPGASRAELFDLMISALPPVEPWESWSLLGPVGSRNIGAMDCGLLDFHKRGLRLDEPLTVPRPLARQVWVYLQLQAPPGYDPAATKAFGPFDPDDKNIRCELYADQWIVAGSTKEEGDAAGLVDRRRSQVHLRVYSLGTGEPIEGADFMLKLDGKHRPVNDSDEDGKLEGWIDGDNEDCRVRHPMFRELRLEPLLLKPGGIIDLGDVGLEPLRIVRGQLVDGDGQAVASDRSLRWTDSDGDDRWTRCEDDGSFILGVREKAPASVRVMGESSPNQVGTLVPLVPSPAPDVGRPAGPVLCQVPPEIGVRVEIEGLPVEVAVQSAPIHLETTYGVVKRIWPRGSLDGKTLFDLTLPPGTYTLSGGVLIAFPPLEFVVSAEPAPESMTLRIPAEPAFR